jgi:hypothetical protein
MSREQQRLDKLIKLKAELIDMAKGQQLNFAQKAILKNIDSQIDVKKAIINEE